MFIESSDMSSKLCTTVNENCVQKLNCCRTWRLIFQALLLNGNVWMEGAYLRSMNVMTSWTAAMEVTRMLTARAVSPPSLHSASLLPSHVISKLITKLPSFAGFFAVDSMHACSYGI